MVLLLELKECLLHLTCCGVGEARQSDIPIATRKGAVVRYGTDLDLLSAELDLTGLRLSRTLYEEGDLTPGCSLESSTHLVGGGLTEVLTIYLEDHVASTKPSQGGRHTLHGVVDDDGAIGTLGDDRANPTVGARGEELQLVAVLCRIVLRIGIEALEHIV